MWRSNSQMCCDVRNNAYTQDTSIFVSSSSRMKSLCEDSAADFTSIPFILDLRERETQLDGELELFLGGIRNSRGDAVSRDKIGDHAELEVQGWQCKDGLPCGEISGKCLPTSRIPKEFIAAPIAKETSSHLKQRLVGLKRELQALDQVVPDLFFHHQLCSFPASERRCCCTPHTRLVFHLGGTPGFEMVHIWFRDRWNGTGLAPSEVK